MFQNPEANTGQSHVRRRVEMRLGAVDVRLEANVRLNRSVHVREVVSNPVDLLPEVPEIFDVSGVVRQ